MSQHKGIVSGPIDNISIPNIISLGDVIKNNKVSLEVKLIEVTKIEKDMIWKGNVIAKAGATHWVLVEEKKYLPHLENNIDKIWIFVSDCKVLE